jgi:hypothetical protein
MSNPDENVVPKSILSVPEVGEPSAADRIPLRPPLCGLRTHAAP